MTKSEMWTCAAALAAGIIAGKGADHQTSVEEAVDLMEQINSEIAAREKQRAKDLATKWMG